jgi:hypothetical protein
MVTITGDADFSALFLAGLAGTVAHETITANRATDKTNELIRMISSHRKEYIFLLRSLSNFLFW